jgi:PilZ domain
LIDFTYVHFSAEIDYNVTQWLLRAPNMLRSLGAGMSSQEDESGSFMQRRYARGHVQILAQIREKGYGHHKALVSDLSRAGCRVCTPMYLNKENSMFITLPGFAAIEAKICWQKRDDYGCEFVTELHEAIFEHILRTHPSLRRG